LLPSVFDAVARRLACLVSDPACAVNFLECLLMLMTFPRRMRGLASILLLLCAWGGIDSLAVAATIIWGTPQTISGDTDVATTGALVYAYNIGGSGVGPTTISGVSFASFAISSFTTSVTVGDVTLSESPGLLIGYDNLGSSGAPYSGLTSDYRSLLNGGGSATQPVTITATLGGLTQGQEYLLQWWSSNAELEIGFSGETLEFTTASAVNSVTLDANISNQAGGLGQYVIGTFTADGPTQQFTLESPNTGFTAPLISGLQVRAVPEPATYVMALAGLACGGYAMRRRKRGSRGHAADALSGW